MDLPRVCRARRESFLELFGDTLECKGKGVGYNSQGACPPRSFSAHAHARYRRAHSQRPIAFALPLLLTVGRERSYPFLNSSRPILLHSRSVINKTPTPCISSSQLLSVCSRTHRLHTLLSLPIAILPACLPLTFQRSGRCTGRTNSTSRFRLSVHCFRSTLQHRSSSFRSSVLHFGCLMSIGTIVSSLCSCSLFLSAPSCGRYVIL
jgi:hypothetical protein